MLTMSVIHSVDYYSDLAAEDYYVGAGEPSGEWAGKGAVLLGLGGPVADEEYHNVMRGLSPCGTFSLSSSSGRAHRAGWDLTFSCPKSVSLIWARSREGLREEIERAHKRSVESALEFLEENAAVARRGHNGSRRESAVGLTAILFNHCTSRTLDPQLHTHCLIANVAPRKDGSWGSIESRDLYLWQRAAGAIFRAELACQLSQLGFPIERDKDAFRIAGVSEEICVRYSKRGQRIREELEQRGHAKSASKVGDLVALSTRERKVSVDKPSLFSRWHKEFDGLGFTLSFLDEVRDSKEKFLEIPYVESPLEPRRLTEQLTEKLSVFRRQDIYKTAAEAAQWTGETSKAAKQAAAEALRDSQMIFLGEDWKHNQIYSTREIVESEKQMVSGAKRLREQTGFAVNGESLKRAMSQKEFPLSDEQCEAVMSVCQSNRFAVLQGSAGAGKSASMDCVRAAYESEGYKVIGASVAKMAAENLAKEAKIQTYTVAKLLTDIGRGLSPMNKNTVLLIDEAGQLGTGQLLALISAAETVGSKLVLVGEDRQLDSIEHGGSLRYLSGAEVLGATRIKTIRRQRETWAKKAVANFRDGNPLSALGQHNVRGLLYFAQDADGAKARLVDDWNAFRKENPDKKSLVVAQRWTDVALLNAKIRALLQQDGLVGTDEIAVDCCVSERHIACRMATGERVRFTKNDYRYGLTNGQLGTVTRLEKLPGGDTYYEVQIDSGRKVRLKASEYCNERGHIYLAQAYAVTVYSSQGLTVDGDTFVLYSSGMDRANTYVACSRHKDHCHIYVNSKEVDECIEHPEHSTEEQRIQSLSDLMSRDNYKKLAIEYIEQGGVSIIQQEAAISPGIGLGSQSDTIAAYELDF